MENVEKCSRKRKLEESSVNQLEGVLKITVNNINKGNEISQEITETIARMKWDFLVEEECSERTNNVKCLGVFIGCNQESDSVLWSCSVRAKFVLINQTVQQNVEEHSRVLEHSFCYNSEENYEGYTDFVTWEKLTDPKNGYVKDGFIVLEARIEVTKLKGFRLHSVYDYLKPYQFSDAVLVVDGTQIHVIKSYLALHSPFFAALFFSGSDLVENQRKEVPLEDVKVDQIVKLLDVIYPRRKMITKKNVEDVLKLASQFQMDEVINQCERFLLRPKNLPLIKKLLLAGRFCLSRLEDWCLKRLTSVDQIVALKKQPGYDDLDDKIKVGLLERIFTLSI